RPGGTRIERGKLNTKRSVIVHVKLTGSAWHLRFGCRESALAWIDRHSQTITFALIEEAK
ncbi:MAG TPA: hypothetical protein VFO40_04365, partial [Chthoniobacterales bacterium]|nr:hypothetical protein [Chthoniobacterales bacterium]